MNLDWTKNLKTEKEIEDFKNSLRGSRRILDRLTELLNEYEKSLNRSELNTKAFEDPNWAYLQAYKNGYRACLEKLKELIDLDQKILKI